MVGAVCSAATTIGKGSANTPGRSASPGCSIANAAAVTAFDGDRNEVSITVADNGEGIPVEQLRHVFRPFHSSKGHGGTGLGLAATKKIVDELHGRIEVQSAPAEGTTFTIYLPAAARPASDADKTQSPAR